MNGLGFVWLPHFTRTRSSLLCLVLVIVSNFVLQSARAHEEQPVPMLCDQSREDPFHLRDCGGSPVACLILADLARRACIDEQVLLPCSAIHFLHSFYPNQFPDCLEGCSRPNKRGSCRKYFACGGEFVVDYEICEGDGCSIFCAKGADGTYKWTPGNGRSAYPGFPNAWVMGAGTPTCGYEFSCEAQRATGQCNEANYGKSVPGICVGPPRQD